MDLTTTSLCIICLMGRPRADGNSAPFAVLALPSEAPAGRLRRATRNGTGGKGNATPAGRLTREQTPAPAVSEKTGPGRIVC